MKSALQRIARESELIGYRADAILRDYPFSTSISSNQGASRAPLAVFTQTPPSYRSAAFGASLVDNRGAEALVNDFRDLGAPLFFVIEGASVSVWQVYAGGPPRFLERASLEAVDRLFSAHKDVWNPKSIYRAKAIGRFNPTYQLDFVDVGLMPAIEGQIHEKLDRLLTSTLEAARGDSKIGFGKSLFQSVFRLVAAKILTDREHALCKTWREQDVYSVLRGIGSHYGLPDTEIHNTFDDRLAAAWAILRDGLNVANISADDLAFVYENTLVTPETRREYGTHSTPRHVAEYVVGRLDLCRESSIVPTVYEPFAGAGVFLVSALRHLREGLPHSWKDRQRHDLLVKKIKGSEIDPFACEVAVLSLILADYPNKNGWRIENVDLFEDNVMMDRLKGADVVLCNPPFEIFSAEERQKYPQMSGLSGNRAEAVLGATLRATPSSVGFVLPRTFLMDRSYSEHRRTIERLYREVEFVSLPDGMFKVSQVESALLIARDIRESGDSQIVRSSEVDDNDRRSFALSGLTSRMRQELRSPTEDFIGDLWIPALRPLWKRLDSLPKLSEVMEGHWGLRWLDRRQREAGFDKPGPDRHLGLLRANDHRQFCLGHKIWVDTNPEHLYGGGNLPWSRPKILCNAARLSRSYWRLAAATDRDATYASQQFVALWPKTDLIDLDAIVAVLNGPIANAFMVDHSTEKRFRIRTLLEIPIPQVLPSKLGGMAREYTGLLGSKDILRNEERLAQLLDQIDVLVLEAYDLPPKLTRALLASFRGARRPIAHEWVPWNVSVEDPALSLRELRSGLLDQMRGNWLQEKLKPVPEDEAAILSPFLS